MPRIGSILLLGSARAIFDASVRQEDLRDLVGQGGLTVLQCSSNPRFQIPENWPRLSSRRSARLPRSTPTRFACPMRLFPWGSAFANRQRTIGRISSRIEFHGLHAAAGVHGVLGGRSGTADVARSRKAPGEHGHQAYGEGARAEPRLSRKAAESASSD